MREVHLGWLSNPLSIEAPTLFLRPHKDFDARVDSIKKRAEYGRRYFVPPIAVDDWEGVAVPVARFELPATHMLLIDRQPDRDLDLFVVAVLGFFLGLKLLPEGYGHLHRLHHTPHQNAGFVPSPNEIRHGLDRALELYDGAEVESAKNLFAIIHWYLTAQVHVHQFERFAWLYTTLDALHAGAWRKPDYQDHCNRDGRKRKSAAAVLHADRPVHLATYFETPVPKNVQRMVDIRNDLLHEARFVGEPIGFAATEEANDIEHELSHFIEQLILGMLNVRCQYRRVEYDWQQHGLDVDGLG